MEARALRFRVHAEDVPLGKSGGIEGFVRGLITGLATVPDLEVELCVARGTAGAWRTYLPPGIRVDITEASLSASPDALPGGARLKALLRRYPWAWRFRNWLRSRGERPPTTATVDYFPFHRGRGFGQLRAVTVHDLRAFDADYGDTISAVNLQEHLDSADAVFTSWAHPHRQLLQRRPDLAPRLHRVPFPAMNPVPDGVARPKGVPTSGRFLLYPAGMVPHKNHLLLVEAARRLPEDSDLAFVLTGNDTGDHARAVREAIAAAGVGHRFHILGFVDETELRWLYEHCWALIMPSLYEAASGPLMEAMQYAKPLLAADIDIFRSQMEECGGSAVFFDPRDARSVLDGIERLAGDHETYILGATRGGEWYARLTWESTARRYVDAVRDRLA